MSKRIDRQRLVWASGRSRAGKRGKTIIHPKCGASFKVYHFAWSACICKCGALVEREDFLHLVG